MTKTAETKLKDGKIISIVGVVVDVEFTDGAKLPAIYHALHVAHDGKTITLEVAQHLDEHTVRTIALSSTDGLKRGQDVVSTGAPISVPPSPCDFASLRLNDTGTSRPSAANAQASAVANGMPQ